MLFNVWALIWPNQKKILGPQARERRGEGQGAQGRDARLAHELRAVDPDAALHGLGRRTGCRSEHDGMIDRRRTGTKVRVPRSAHDPDAAPVLPKDLARTVAAALDEDVGSGDLTAALVPAGRAGRATVITREAAVVAGRPYVDEVFRQLDPPCASNGTRRTATSCGRTSCCTASAGLRALAADRRAHGPQFLQVLSAHGDGDAPLRRGARRAARARCSTRARPCRACATRRSTRCVAAAASITGSGSTTASWSRRTTSWRPARSRRPWRAAASGAGASWSKSRSRRWTNCARRWTRARTWRCSTSSRSTICARRWRSIARTRTVRSARGLGRRHARDGAGHRRDWRRFRLGRLAHQARARGGPFDAVRVRGLSTGTRPAQPRASRRWPELGCKANTAAFGLPLPRAGG